MVNVKNKINIMQILIKRKLHLSRCESTARRTFALLTADPRLIPAFLMSLPEVTSECKARSHL